MADQKLSELTTTSGLNPSDLLYVVQGATSKKVAVSSLTATFSTSMTGIFVLPTYSSTSNATATTGSVFIHSVEGVIKWYNGASWNSL